jgi:SHS2 domain-containing protein
MLAELPGKKQTTARMQPFRFLDHPADVGFEAFGGTLGEVFANAARALTDLRVDIGSVAPREMLEIKVRGSDWPGLLVNWLSEILYLEDAESWLLCEFQFCEFEPSGLAAQAHGEKFDPGRHHGKGLVKAITYHQLALEKKGDLWRAQVFVDV